MTLAGWFALCGLGATAGAFCAGIALCAAGVWRSAPGAFAPLLGALAVFAFTRAFPAALPIAAVSAFFALIAAYRLGRERELPAPQKILAIAPLLAIVVAIAGQIAGNSAQRVAESFLAIALASPIAILIALRLRLILQPRRT